MGRKMVLVTNATTYDGDTIMFKAKKNYSYLHDPMLRWGGLLTGPLEFIELPTTPGGLFMEPYAQILAEKLKERHDDAGSSISETLAPQSMESSSCEEERDLVGTRADAVGGGGRR